MSSVAGFGSSALALRCGHAQLRYDVHTVPRVVAARPSISRARVELRRKFLSGGRPHLTVTVHRVTVAPASTVLSVGQTVALVASVNHDPTLTPILLVWSSSDSSKAIVDANGIVTAIAATPGVAICAEAAGKKACATLIVSAAATVVPQMARARTPSVPTAEEVALHAELERKWPAVRVPGYWSTVEENCKQWAREISVGPLWSEAKNRLVGWSADFRRKSGGVLVAAPLPDFVGKGADRTKKKVISKCADDAAFAREALGSDGPPVPRLSDLVRTRISCKFLDGVEYLAERLNELAIEQGVAVERQRQGKLVGYFAQHVTFAADVHFRMAGHAEPVRISCEIQVATELSSQIWEAAHPVYEIARVRSDDPEDWQWSPKDPRFIARQLGHMIHLADGILVQLRDSTRSTQDG
jgi:hypothetical protein